MNSASPIGKVRCDGVLISVSAITNSSQAALKVKTATVASAGAGAYRYRVAAHPAPRAARPPPRHARKPAPKRSRTIRASGRIWCTIGPRILPQARILPGKWCAWAQWCASASWCAQPGMIVVDPGSVVDWVHYGPPDPPLSPNQPQSCAVNRTGGRARQLLRPVTAIVMPRPIMASPPVPPTRLRNRPRAYSGQRQLVICPPATVTVPAAWSSSRQIVYCPAVRLE